MTDLDIADLDIAHTRLQRQGIAGAGFDTAGEVVRWMGALQAQDYQQSLWAIGSRMRQGTVADVEAAIRSGEILRTWPLRGTLHFVPAEDARWMVELSAARMIAKDARRLRQLELEESTLGRCKELVETALRGGRWLSRPRLMARLEEAGVSTAGQRGYHILWWLAQSAVICLGPMEGKQQIFVLLDEWAPAPRKLPRAEALAELALRYFISHGPATIHDFAWWAGLTVTDARAALEGARPGLLALRDEERECWMSDHNPQGGGTRSTAAFLLPAFDEFLLGYRDRGDALVKEHAAKVSPGGNGVFRSMAVVDGQITGTWRRKLTGDGVEVTVAAFSARDEGEQLWVESARAYADFLVLPLASTSIERRP